MVAAFTDAAAPPAQLGDLSWMAGHWLECSPDAETTETWTDDHGGVMLGISKSLRRSSTHWEFARIDRTPEGITFFASPKGQQGAAFHAVSIARDRVVFEQRDHDFPQRVIYMRRDDRLTGRIEGVIDGRPRTVEWHYHRSPLGATCKAGIAAE
jgi:hypothetical protein